ncbi:MAG: hypothetical protein FWC20_01655 [Oscillospiraceae bacterium]|nr:hypothetical protein [Oscillospiraceae bacterium]MCL2278099.1 hypothetical protein [Oscillospiraceae bacterium]
MEAVRQVIDSTLLSGIIPLPKKFENKRVEIVVSLNEEEKAIPSLSMSDIDSMLKGSITESLTGAIPQTEKTLDNYRAERLSKYECSN